MIKSEFYLFLYLYIHIQIIMKMRRPGQQTRGEDNLYQKGASSQDYKKIINQKIEVRRTKGYQDKYGFRGQRNQSPQEPILSAQTSKSQTKVRPNNKRYFKKEQGDDKVRTSASQDAKPLNNLTKQDSEEKTSQGIQRTNSEYLKLHDKLNFLQSKIADMKKNLQKKKQQKMRRQKEKEEQKQRKQMEDKKRNKKQTKLDAIVTSVPERKQLHTFQKNPYSPRHNIYYVSEIVRAYQDSNSLAREHLQTTLQIMAYFDKMQIPGDQKIASKKVKLARRQGYQDKKTVIFDLDETLIHCNESTNVPYDVKLPIVFPTGEIIEAGINIRPYAFQILQNLSKNFQIIVFTASHSCYANVVLDHLDPQNKYIHHRLFREHCYATPEGMHVKDLRVVDRQFSQMVLVDNAAYSYAYQPANGIPIIPYYHGDTDFQLHALQKYIESMMFVQDMRTVNRKTFKLHQYNKYYYDLEQLVQKLYLTEHNS